MYKKTNINFLSSIQTAIIKNLARLSRVTARIHLSLRPLHAPPPLAIYKRICQKLLLNECCVIVADLSQQIAVRSSASTSASRSTVWHAFAATPTATTTATATATAYTIEMISLSCQILTSVVIQAVKHFALAVKNRQIREFVEFCQTNIFKQFVEFFGICGIL